MGTPVCLGGGVLMLSDIYTRGSISMDALLTGIIAIFFWIFLVHFSPMEKVRYNRQAQLVHFRSKLGYGKFVTVAWRDVVAYYTATGVSGLRIFYPGNDAANGYKPLGVRLGGITLSSFGNFSGPYGDWEVIRSYMEGGWDAIQPKEEDINEYTSKQAPQGLTKWMMYPCLGPYIDWVMRKRRAKYKWPEDIEALCAVDAREKGLLNDYDREPIESTWEKHNKYG
jgi:hypothetical protein